MELEPSFYENPSKRAKLACVGGEDCLHAADVITHLPSPLPLVSIIVPVHNAAHDNWLDDSLGSVMSQVRIQNRASHYHHRAILLV